MTRSIIAKLEKAEAYNVARRKARDFRLSAALELLAEQERVQQDGSITWRDWCKENLPELSPQKIASLLRLARGDQHRPRRTPRPSPPDSRPMLAAKQFFCCLSWDERGRFMRWVKETGLY
jgi:hypothetical protein